MSTGWEALQSLKQYTGGKISEHAMAREGVVLNLTITQFSKADIIKHNS